MNPVKRKRLTVELMANQKRIEVILKEAETLEQRNYDIEEELHESDDN